MADSDVFDTDDTEHDTSETRTRTRRRGRRVMGTFFIGLLVVLLIGGGFLFWYLNRVSQAIDQIKHDPSLMPDPSSSVATPRPPDPSKADPDSEAPMTFVLMGSDSRGSDQGRSDSLMVAYLSGNRKNIYLISFPRDMWVSVPGRGKAKINAAYAWGGPPLTIQTLEGMTGVRMQHAGIIDFPGFIELTTVLGGVEIYNEHASKSDGFTFPEGYITIQGEQALAYVRERYDLPNGDLDRAKRQRAVVSAIMAKVLTPSTLGNPGKFGSTVDAFAKCMTVDTGLDKKTITSTATSLRITGPESIRSLQAPISGFGTSPDGQSIDVVDEGKLAELSKAMKTDTMEEYFAKYPS